MSQQNVFVPPWERPIRIPGRVPVMHVEPGFAIVEEKSQWRLTFQLAEDVAGGAELKLQMFGGRNNRSTFQKWRLDCPVGPADMRAATADGAPLAIRPDRSAGTLVLTVPQEGLAEGALVHVDLDDPEHGGVCAPSNRLLNKFFVLHRPGPDGDPPPTWCGESLGLIVGACTMHVLGGPMDHIHAYAPSQAVVGELIEVLVRPEDRFDNLSHQRLGKVDAFLGDDKLDARAEPVTDSVCVRLRLELPREGVHRVRVREAGGGAEATAAPTLCTASPRPGAVYWGMIHGHTEMSDGTGTLDHYFHQLRDEAGLDFAAPGDHDHLHETSGEMWEVTCEKVRQWHQPGRFVTFLGYEWAKWRQNGDGDRNVYYRQDSRPLYRSDHGEHPTPPDLFRALADEQAIVIPHHTGHRGNFCDWKDHDPVCERLVEIYQVRGSYECPEAEGNPLDEHFPDPPFTEGYVRRALALGWRVGFTAGGDDHGGYAGTGKCKDGLMSVEAAARTREAIWEAMWNRRVVATTGARLLLSWELNGHPMGSELDVGEEPELASCRALKIGFHGTAPISELTVIRNNRVVLCVHPGTLDGGLSWQDTEPLHDTLLPAAKFCDHPFCFYYVRLAQADGETAWASPIWIDAR